MSVYAERYGEPHVREDGTTYQTLAVRCGDCGQRAVETYNADSWLRCPDAAAGPCGNDPLTTERRDGPRYVEAVREGRRLRERAAVRVAVREINARFLGSVEAPPDFDVVKATRP